MFTCEHVLAEGDEKLYKNTASIEGGGKEKTSNTVEVEIELPSFTIKKEQRIKRCSRRYTTAKLKLKSARRSNTRSRSKTLGTRR